MVGLSAPPSFKVDEHGILKLYKIASLRPSKWEEIDIDAETYNGIGSMHEDDPLGLETAQSWRQLDPDTQATTSLTSLTFDPKAYLSLAHPQATYPDLARGVAHLERILEARKGAVRVLVEESFSRFVVVKGATECLYDEMKNDVLSAERDHATQPLFNHVRDGARKGNQIFLPVLEAAENAEQLRKTLGVFERSKFFFNLPSFIMESIVTGHYELALRDYKKGKYMLEHRPAQLLPISSISISAPGSLSAVSAASAHARAQQQQTRVLNKVWAGVERAMAELKNVLIIQLMDPGRSIEDQEKALETLLEIPADDDPLWMYFDNHHTNMMDALTGAYHAGVKEIDCVLRTPGVIENAENTSKTELRRSIEYLYMKQSDSAIAKSSAEPIWDAIFKLVKAVCEPISSSLPCFWRISKDLVDGKIKKNPTSCLGGKRSPKQCRTMAFDIVKLYISLISQLFVLSDMVVMSTTEKHGGNSLNNLPARIPINSHSLCTAYHLQHILNEVQECVNEVMALNISSEARDDLTSLMDSVKWRFMDILVTHWVRDARMFYLLETWVATWDATSMTTRHLRQFELFQKQMMTVALRIATSGNTPLSKTSKHKGIPQALASKITKAVFDSVRAFLDGLSILASEDYPYIQGPVLIEAQGSTELCLQDLVDLKDPDNRLLVVISNINRFWQQDFPGMIKQMENSSGITFAEQKLTLAAALEELDETLLERYIKPRVQIFKALLRDAVLHSGFDWCNAPLPIAIRSQTFKTLNYLIEIHAHLCDITPGLVEKILRSLIYELVSEISRAFRQVHRFGRGGLLTAIIDVTFIQKSLGSYGRETKIARAFENLINKQLKGSHDSLTKTAGFEADYAETQKVVADARSTTSVHFLCFRRASDNETSGSGMKASKSKTRIQKELHLQCEQPGGLDFT